jgi:DNA-binding NtrC family response regulator
MQHAVAVGSRTPLQAADLAFAADPGAGTPADDAPALQALDALMARLLTHVPGPLHAIVEGALVRAVHQHCGGHQVQAAQRLGVTRNTVRTLFMRHGLLLPHPRRR